MFKSIGQFLRRVEQRAVTAFGSLSADARFVTAQDDLTFESDLPTVRRVAGYPPVSQALQMIAGDCAKLPCRVYQRYNSDGVENRYWRPNHYASTLIDLWGSPNDTDTTFDLFFDWFFECLLFGGGYLYIHRDGAMPVSIHKLLPDRTWPVYYKGKRYFQTQLGWSEGDQHVEYLPNDDVLFLQGVNLSPFGPSNPIKLYQETFRQAINAADYTSGYFKKGTQAGGILMAPPGASETSVKNIEAAVESRTKRENWFRTLVLKDGFRWQSVTGSLRDATTVELDESTARHVARIFNIPPSKLGLKDAVSYNSLEQDTRQYIDSCLSTWLIQARSQFHRKLIIPSEQSTYVTDYEIDYLNWADPKARADVFAILIDKEIMTSQEVRTKYGLPPSKVTQQPPVVPSTVAPTTAQ